MTEPLLVGDFNIAISIDLIDGQAETAWDRDVVLHSCNNAIVDISRVRTD
jgi:hypothetical protein